MSHLSKIKTNISNIDILKKTLNEMGLYYIFNKSLENGHYLSVYHENNESEKIKLCYFEYDGFSYSLVADLQLWNMGITFDSFHEKLKQRYACNVILQQSNSNGFSKISENVMEDGSVRVLVHKWI